MAIAARHHRSHQGIVRYLIEVDETNENEELTAQLKSLNWQGVFQHPAN
jgi:hypothetical protein